MSIKVSPEVRTMRKNIDGVDAATAGIERDLISARAEADDTPESRKAYFAYRQELLEDMAYNHSLRARLMDKMQAQLEAEEQETNAATEAEGTR